MNKKTLQIIVTILSMSLLFPVFSKAQGGKKIVRVSDESGNPVSGASVIIGEGNKAILTNENGEFILQTDSVVPVLIEAQGYETRLLNIKSVMGLDSIFLTQSIYQMGEKDKVQMPFGSFFMREVPGSVTVLSPRELLKYDQTDVMGALEGRIPGMFGSSSIRGMESPLVVIDGIPRPVSEVNLQQIEQITVVKDLSLALLYGSQASNGVILITTRRGEPLKKVLQFTAENGFSKPISYPKYLNAGDYMELYNEALANDGLVAKYSPAEISGTRNGNDPVHYPDESYYNSTYLKDWTTYQNIVGEASGGNEVAQYYLNLGWRRENGLLKIGEGDNEKTDRLNMRGNIDYKLNDAIKLRFDGTVIFNISNQPRYTDENCWELFSTLHPEYYPVLIPYGLITDSTLLGAAKLVNGQYVLGGTSEHLTNIYGELTKNGPSKTNDRLIQISTGLDFDLKAITQGLTASVYFSFDIYNMFTTGLLNNYAVYQPIYSGDTLSGFSKYGVDAKVDAQSVTDVNFYRRTGIYGTLDYNRSFGDHTLKATALAFRDQYSVENVLQPTKHMQLGMRADYIFQNKIIAEFTGVVAGSSKLFETVPYAFSPGVSFSWILSEEDLLKDNPIVDYLKVRANWAINHTDESIQDFYLGRDLYMAGTLYEYNQRLAANTGRILSSGNPNLGWEKNMNINIGFESMLLDYKLGFSGTFFYNKNSDLLSRNENILPVYFTSLPWENYGSTQSQGVEFGLNYRITTGALDIKLGSNLVFSVPKVLAKDELNYPDEYRSNIGRPTDAIFGFVAEGLFADQNDINNSPFQTFGTVQPGDIKYKDLNGDNLIDNEDQEMIGHSNPRLGYGLTLNIRYKGIELFLLGTGQSGQSILFNSPYYWVYGDRKYSEEVLNRWTSATASTATYPRLSSTSDANNFINSTYWLYKNDWFKLQTVQLTYSLEDLSFAGLDEARFFVRGNNLAHISKIKDKTDLNIGTAPRTRSLSLGFTLLF